MLKKGAKRSKERKLRFEFQSFNLNFKSKTLKAIISRILIQQTFSICFARN